VTDHPSEERRRLTWLRRGVWVVLALGVVAFLVKGANNPADPVLVPAGDGGEVRSGEAPPGRPPASLPDLGEAMSPGAQRLQEALEGLATTTTTTAASPSTPGVPAPGPGPPAAVERPSPAPPPAPSPAPAPATEPEPSEPERRPLEGFDDIAFRVASPAGGAFEGVAMLADDQATRSRGLMEQTDLRGYDGMIFRFPSATTGRFFMRNTRIPLSIAFFDGDGRFVSSADMEPCPDDVDRCPTYGADRPYVHAIEVPLGGLGRLGIGPGSVLSF
jgi:uncharacterized membrane protein (UPF0127 family)